MEQECCGTVIHVGNGYATLVETVSHDIEISDLGEAKISITYECKFENALELIARIKRHPQFTFLKAKSKRISRKEGCMATVTIGFEGIVPDDSPEAKEGRKTYSIEGSTQQEPIETHPDFVEFDGNWRERGSWKNYCTIRQHRSKIIVWQAEARSNCLARYREQGRRLRRNCPISRGCRKNNLPRNNKTTK